MIALPVSAYFYSTREKEIIFDHVKAVEETEAYIFGTIEPSGIKALREQRILLDLHLDPSKSKGGIPRSLSSPGKGRRSVQLNSSISQDVSKSHKSGHYIIQLPGPLLSTWKHQMQRKNMVIMELLEDKIYRVKTSQPEVLAKFDFIQDFRPYGIQDKDLLGQRSISSTFDPFISEVIVSGLYDIRLCPDANIPRFIAFLKKRNIQITEHNRLKVRVKLSNESDILQIGQREDVYGIEQYVKPELHNNLARQLIHVDFREEQYLLPYELNGIGELVGIADTGIDIDHPDLKDNVLNATAWGRENDSSDPNGHGTHVAGSVAGTGRASEGEIKGIAPEAKIFFQSVLDENGGIGGLPLDLHELFQEAYNAGVRIHNNSWGSATESEYRFNSLEVDDFVYTHKDFLLIISAGNEGTAFQPRNSNPGFVDWLSIGSPATAKNALTVGASRSNRERGGFSTLTYGQAWSNKFSEVPIRDKLISGDPECLAAFSSRGPCGNESRIKPDVVAPGTDISSAKSSTAPASNFWGPYPKNRNYAFMGGTSMATPIVSGFAALIRQYLRLEKGYKEPSAALMKAMIINSTRDLKGEDSLADHDYIPNFHQGFGCIDLYNLLPSSKKKSLALRYLDPWKNEDLQFTASGQRFLFRFTINEGLPLRLCLTWTDPPGRGLQNNLNLLLLHVKTNMKWVGNERIPRMITSFDRDNNVEVLRIEDPQGGEYRIAIQANNLLVGKQDFAVVITGDIKGELEQLT